MLPLCYYKIQTYPFCFLAYKLSTTHPLPIEWSLQTFQQGIEGSSHPAPKLSLTPTSCRYLFISSNHQTLRNTHYTLSHPMFHTCCLSLGSHSVILSYR